MVCSYMIATASSCPSFCPFPVMHITLAIVNLPLWWLLGLRSMLCRQHSWMRRCVSAYTLIECTMKTTVRLPKACAAWTLKLKSWCRFSEPQALHVALQDTSLWPALHILDRTRQVIARHCSRFNQQWCRLATQLHGSWRKMTNIRLLSGSFLHGMQAIWQSFGWYAQTAWSCSPTAWRLMAPHRKQLLMPILIRPSFICCRLNMEPFWWAKADQSQGDSGSTFSIH